MRLHARSGWGMIIWPAWDKRALALISWHPVTLFLFAVMLLLNTLCFAWMAEVAIQALNLADVHYPPPGGLGTRTPLFTFLAMHPWFALTAGFSIGLIAALLEARIARHYAEEMLKTWKQPWRFRLVAVAIRIAAAAIVALAAYMLGFSVVVAMFSCCSAEFAGSIPWMKSIHSGIVKRLESVELESLAEMNDPAVVLRNANRYLFWLVGVQSVVILASFILFVVVVFQLDPLLST